MDTQLAIASKRDTRTYGDGDIPEDVLERILQAGRMAGSGMNRQQRRFVVLREKRRQASEMVTRPSNVRDTPVTVAIVSVPSSYSSFDAGRAAQNMMLAAWDEGIASCPNALADPEGMAKLLGASDEEEVSILISLGPSASGDPARKTIEQWHESADRVPLDQLVDRR